MADADEALASAKVKVDDLRAEMDECKLKAKRLGILERAASIIARLDQVTEQMRKAEESKHPNHAMLKQSSRIDELASQASAAKNDIQDLELRGQERDHIEKQAMQLAKNLGWKKTGIKGIEGLIAPEHVRMELEEIIEGRLKGESELRGMLASLEQSITEDVRELSAVQLELDQAIGILQPWLGTAVQLGELQVPTLEEHEIEAEAVRKLADVAQKKAEALSSATELLVATQRAEQDAQQYGKAPTKDELDEARTHRDGLLEQLLVADDPQGSAAGYRGSVARADAMADTRFAHAAEAVQAEDRKREIERLPTMIAELRKEADDAQEAVNKHEHAWEQRMAACGLAGLGLAAYKTWRLRYDAALELIKKLVRLKGVLKANRKQLRELQQKESGDDDHFRALLKSCSVPEDAGLTGSVVVA